MTNTKSKPIGKAPAASDHSQTTTVRFTCACYRDLSLEELKEAYPDRKSEIIEEFHPELNLTMSNYGITQCIRKAHFLAQVGHESSELKYTAEILGKGVTEESAYGGYKGRGLIQLTGIDNYRSYGAYIKQDLTGENKFKVEKPKLASDSAGWYWIAGRGENLNGPADENDLIYLTASINGAFNGYEGSATSRLTLLRNAANALHIAACPRMDALYSVFPEAERFSTESYTLEKSRAYEKHDMAFAWGYWHDPTSKQHGTRKDKEQAVIGYRRYLELLEAKPLKAKKGRFKLSRVEMKNLAEERLNALSK